MLNSFLCSGCDVKIMLAFSRPPPIWNVHWERFSVYLAGIWLCLKILQSLLVPLVFYNGLQFGWVWFQVIGCELIALECSFHYDGLTFFSVESYIESLQILSTFFTICKCGFVSVPQITMSSMEVSMFFIPLNILHIVLWYISGADDIPNGNLWYLYLPSSVIKVNNLELSSSNCSSQNPFEQFNLENIFAPVILTITPSCVDNLKCSWRIGLLRSSEILNFSVWFMHNMHHDHLSNGLSYLFLSLLSLPFCQVLLSLY